MLRQFLFLGVGGLALTVVLGAPGQLHAQRFRASLPPAIQPGFRGAITPRFPIGVNPGFNRVFNRRFDPFENRFNRGFFTPSFNRGSFVPNFNGGFFVPSFNRGFFDPRFNMGFSPGFNMGFSPLFFRPF
jgi:hypothetical protein